MKTKPTYRDVLGYLLIGISVIMLGKSLTLCFSNDIWYDELFTVGMIEHSYGDLIAFTAKDVHPPLYYCIVKFFVELCKLAVPTASTVVTAKIVSVLPYFILLLYSVTFIRKRFGIFTGGIFLFCVISMPQLSAYTVEVRMYSLALLFVTAAFLHAYAVVTGDDYSRTRLHAAALVLYGIAAAYTQYFACVAVIMVYLYVLIAFLVGNRRRVREWFMWVAVSVVGYAPWLYALYTQITAVNENYWILPLTWRTLGGCVKFLMKPAFTNEALSTVLAVVLFVIYGIVVVYCITKLCHYSRDFEKNSEFINNRDREHANSVSREQDYAFFTAGIGVLAGLVLFGFVASAVLRPIFVYRYMIPALGCFWLSFAVGLGLITERNASVPNSLFISVRKRITEKTIYPDKLTETAMIAVCALILLIGLRDYRAFMGEEEYKILLMKDTNEAFREIDDEDVLIFNFDQVQMVVGYYIDNESYLWYGQPEALIQEICGEKGTLNEDTGQIKEWISQGRKVWFMGSFNSREDIVEEWRGAGITVNETGSYLLERYWFNIYELSLSR